MALTALTGCYDLSTEPYNQYVTEDQKTQVKNDNPEMALASITGITGIFSTFQQVLDNHLDYGIPSVMLWMDSRGVEVKVELLLLMMNHFVSMTWMKCWNLLLFYICFPKRLKTH